MRTFRVHSQAFTLVEMAIVLAIIGLIVGGVIAGRELINNAQLKTVISEYRKYVQVVGTFKDKYYALPGDMTNAATVWGAADGVGVGNSAACATTASTDSKTCNGNGDNMIATSTSSAECYRFWQQLANAGLIEGTYTGVAGSANTPGINVPKSRASGFGWYVCYIAPTTGDTVNFAADYENFLQLTSTINRYPLVPTDAWTIDTKIDDGMPGTGTVVTNKQHPASENCTSADGVAPPGDAGATYNLSGTSAHCKIIFIRAF